MSFRCAWCGEEHGGGEPGFAWPDAVFALSLPEDERARLQDGENEDVAVVRDACFVRGVAFVPVVGRPDPIALGFWFQISAADFADFEGRERSGHPDYPGRVANQSFFLASTLGIEGHMVERGQGLRPGIVLGGDHPLARAQEAGISEEVVRGWLAATLHQGDKEPAGPPFVADLARHGFELLDPREAGRATAKPQRAPARGDNAKVIVAFEASTETGDAKVLTAGWWIELDDVSRPDLWSGSLANRPRVPATISEGSRIWLRPSDVIEYAPPTRS
jgi:hypothetical protein